MNAPAQQLILSDEDIAQQACEMIAAGDRIREVATKLGMHRSVLWRIINRPEYRESYAHAREVRANEHAEDISTTVDQVQAGDIAPDAGRVILDGKKWLASRLDQRRWGDKLTTDVNVTITVDKLAERLASGRVQARITEDVPALRISNNMCISTDSTMSEVRQPVLIEQETPTPALNEPGTRR